MAPFPLEVVQADNFVDSLTTTFALDYHSCSMSDYFGFDIYCDLVLHDALLCCYTDTVVGDVVLFL